jgi:hypothetical protein
MVELMTQLEYASYVGFVFVVSSLLGGLLAASSKCSYEEMGKGESRGNLRRKAERES